MKTFRLLFLLIFVSLGPNNGFAETVWKKGELKKVDLEALFTTEEPVIWIGGESLCGPDPANKDCPLVEQVKEAFPRFQKSEIANRLTDKALLAFFGTSLGKSYCSILTGGRADLLHHFSGLSLKSANQVAKNCDHSDAKLGVYNMDSRPSPLPANFTYLISKTKEPTSAGFSALGNNVVVNTTIDEILDGSYILTVVHELAVISDSKLMLSLDTLMTYNNFLPTFKLFSAFTTIEDSSSQIPFHISEVEIFNQQFRSQLKALRFPPIDFAFASLRAFAIEKRFAAEYALQMNDSKFSKIPSLFYLPNLTDPKQCQKALTVVLRAAQRDFANLSWNFLLPGFLEDFPEERTHWEMGDVQKTGDLKERVSAQVEKNLKLINGAQLMVDKKTANLCTFMAEPMWTPWNLHGVGPKPKPGSWD